MHWAAALFTTSIWMMVAAFWQFYRPLSMNTSHQQIGVHSIRDVVPGILIGILAGLLLS